MTTHYTPDYSYKTGIPSSDKIIREGLILIPDISGYSKFVENTDIVEGRNLMYTLLSSIIKNNTLGLSISEIEGDAILFYKYGTPPAIQSVLKQFERMLQEFNEILSQITNSTVNLSLKMIAHYGPITELTIGRFQKLYGETVTTAHRLLKNSVNSRSYALLTDAFIQKVSSRSNTTAYDAIASSSHEEYSDLKDISYTYFDYEPTTYKSLVYA